MKRIIFLTTGMGVGGAERQICALSDELALLGHKVMIVSMTGVTECRPENSDIKILELEMTRGKINTLKAFFLMRKIIKKFKPDILHSHMIHANIFSRLLRLTTKIPLLINTAHNKNEGGFIRMMAYRYTDFLTDISTNVSQEAVDEFILKRATKKGRMIAVHNGIDHDKFVYNDVWREEKRAELCLQPSDKLLLAVGRLVEAKDYPNLLRAFASLDISLNTRLAIIGVGELSDELIKIAIELNCNDRIYWLGIQHNVEEWYSACDLFILPSRWEGFGLVVAEAMSAERLIVATDAGGVAEVVGNRDCIVPVSDSRALAKKISEVLNYSNEKVAKLKVQNRARIVNNFSIKKTTQKWLELYKVSK